MRWSAVLVVISLLAACNDGDEPAATSVTTTSHPTPSTTASTTTSTSSTPTSTVPTSTVPTSTVSPDDTALLRGDGLGPHHFGDPAAEVEAWLVSQLGPINAWNELREPLTSAATYPSLHWLRRISWGWGLDVVFSDIGPAGATPDGSLQFAAWRYAPFGAGMSAGLPSDDWSLLGTPGGVTVAMPLAELRSRYPSYTIDADGPCAGFGDFATTLGSYESPWLADNDEFDLGQTGTDEANLRGHAAPMIPAYVGRLEAGMRPRCPSGVLTAREPLSGPIDNRLVLRPDGLGQFQIGRSADQLLGDLSATFGPPQQDASVNQPWVSPPTVWDIADTGHVYTQVFRYLNWYDLGLIVILSDVVDPARGAGRPGVLELAGWIAGPRLQTTGGTHVGGTVGTLVAEFDDVSFGQSCPGPMGDLFAAESFRVGTTGGLAGKVADWDVVRAAQERLNANGAALQVNGILDPPTRQALTAFNSARGISNDVTVDNLPIGKATAAALQLAPPPSTTITRLQAGAARQWCWS